MRRRETSVGRAAALGMRPGRAAILALFVASMAAAQSQEAPAVGSGERMPEGTGPEYARPELLASVAELASSLRDPGLVVVDARSEKEYRAGHVPGAVNLEWTDFTEREGARYWQLLPVPEIERRLGEAGVSDDATIIVYGDPKRGWGEDGRLFWMLAYMGCGEVKILNGGWDLWRRENRPISRETASRPAAHFSASVRPELLADRAWMVEHHSDPGVRVIDTRNLAEYRGLAMYGEARGGRIPGARRLHWKRTLGRDMRIRSAAELEAMLDDLDVGPESEVAVYCSGGVRSGHVFFVLQLLGYPRVRNYDGSMWEWAADRALPME